MTNDEKLTILQTCISMREAGRSRAQTTMILIMRHMEPADAVDEAVDACYTFLDSLLRPEVALA